MNAAHRRRPQRRTRKSLVQARLQGRDGSLQVLLLPATMAGQGFTTYTSLGRTYRLIEQDGETWIYDEVMDADTGEGATAGKEDDGLADD